MFQNRFARKLILPVGVVLCTGGIVLGGWAMNQISPASRVITQSTNATPTVALGSPSLEDDVNAVATMIQQAAALTTPAPPVVVAQPTAPEAITAAPTATPTKDPRLEPASVYVSRAVPQPLIDAINRAPLVQVGDVSVVTEPATAALVLDMDADGGRAVYEQVFAVATRFDTIDPTIAWGELVAVWRGDEESYGSIVVLTSTQPTLEQLLGEPSSRVLRGVDTVEDAAALARDVVPSLLILPFDLLIPKLTVFAVEGQNPVENANRFDSSSYPLIAKVYAHTNQMTPGQRPAIHNLLLQLPTTNRNPKRLTVIAMTGVTALVRQTAAQMDTFGNGWPAEVVGPELAAADITHISNEVPFVPGCITNTAAGNLTFCSKPAYMETLTASGVDIIGLTGNHQNDYGREDALLSLQLYADAGLPVYGGGVNRTAAEAPLYLTHNGNRLAFLGANSHGPDFAWARDDAPGSARFDVSAMSEQIRQIKARNKADVILAEVQYQEIYDVNPLLAQRRDFNALVKAGADIVTGVQSHVPQAVEFTEGRLILYGLGNLYFDQMWQQQTREGMIVKHAIYEGRHISTQILTTLLYDYGQPRWTTPRERTALLQRVFAASYWE